MQARTLVLTSFVAGCVAVACRTSQSGSEAKEDSPIADAALGFDVNDVSYLFPKLSGIGEASPRITGDELHADGSQILPDSVFAGIIEFSSQLAPGGLRDRDRLKANWRVQSFRVDPCAPGDAGFVSLTLAEMEAGVGKADCRVEIRLIMQPMEPVGNFAGSGHVADVAMHLSFLIGTGSGSPELARLVTELASLKRQSESLPGGRTSKTPLGRHPGLWAELQADVPGRPFAQAVREFLARNLSASKLSLVTFSQVEASRNNVWLFFGGSVAMVNGEAVWTAFNLPPTPSVQSMQYRPDNAPHAPALVPLPVGPSTNSLFTSGSVGRGVLINPVYGIGASGRTMPIPTAQALISRIEDPTVSNIFNTDCVSCHTSTSRAITLGIPAAGMATRPRGITGYGLSPEFSFGEMQQRLNVDGLQISTWNIRNFGWFDWQATVSNRTVNEAMASALYVNGLFFRGARPGLDCTEADAQGAVSTCLLEGKGDRCFAGCAAGQ